VANDCCYTTDPNPRWYQWRLRSLLLLVLLGYMAYVGVGFLARGGSHPFRTSVVEMMNCMRFLPSPSG
jgi:hypothetical protein